MYDDLYTAACNNCNGRIVVTLWNATARAMFAQQCLLTDDGRAIADPPQGWRQLMRVLQQRPPSLHGVAASLRRNGSMLCKR